MEGVSVCGGNESSWRFYGGDEWGTVEGVYEVDECMEGMSVCERKSFVEGREG